MGQLLARIDTGTPAGDTAVPAAIPERMPVLVGYGADESMDISRRPRATPKVRKLATDLGVDLADVQPHPTTSGIITRQDVLAAAEKPGMVPGPRCAVADGGANVVGAQHCSRCPRKCAG